MEHRPGSAEVWASPRAARLGASGEDGERGRKGWCVAQDGGRGCDHVTGTRPGRGRCFVGQKVVLRRFGDITEMKEELGEPQGCEDRPHRRPSPSRAVALRDVAADRHKSKQRSDRARLLGMRTARSKTGRSAELRPGLTGTLKYTGRSAHCQRQQLVKSVHVSKRTKPPSAQNTRAGSQNCCC